MNGIICIQSPKTRRKCCNGRQCDCNRVRSNGTRVINGTPVAYKRSIVSDCPRVGKNATTICINSAAAIVGNVATDIVGNSAPAVVVDGSIVGDGIIIIDDGSIVGNGSIINDGSIDGKC